MLTDARLAAIAALLPDDFTAEEAIILIHAEHELQRNVKPLPVLPQLARPSSGDLAAESETQ